MHSATAQGLPLPYHFGLEKVRTGPLKAGGAGQGGAQSSKAAELSCLLVNN